MPSSVQDCGREKQGKHFMKCLKDVSSSLPKEGTEVAFVPRSKGEIRYGIFHNGYFYQYDIEEDKSIVEVYNVFTMPVLDVIYWTEAQFWEKDFVLPSTKKPNGLVIEMTIITDPMGWDGLPDHQYVERCDGLFDHFTDFHWSGSKQIIEVTTKAEIAKRVVGFVGMNEEFCLIQKRGD